MDERLYIVVYRLRDERWRAMSDGEFTERRLADNFIECKRATGWKESFDFAIVEGPVVVHETAAELEARLGAF